MKKGFLAFIILLQVEFPKKNGQLLLNGLIFQELHRTSVAQC